jgi:pilus assembly protein CpaE
VSEATVACSGLGAKALAASKGFPGLIAALVCVSRPIRLLSGVKETRIPLRSIIISPDHELGRKLTAALEATGQVEVARTLDHYPTAIELLRTLRALATEIVFINFESLKQGLETVRILEADGSQRQIVGFQNGLDTAVLRETMRAGVREFLIDPFEPRVVLDSIESIKTLLNQRPAVNESTNQIFSFLPSKAGVGASTIAANVSGALARRPNTRVLLSDFDLSSGMLRFMLKLTNEYSVPDAISRVADIDENLWPQLVTPVAGMDVLHAGRINPSYRIEPAQVANLLAFMRRTYQVLCFDLSGNLEKYSIELMQESKRILLVCTGEVPSLHLAREKLAFLRDMGLSGRVSLVLNRMRKNPLFSTAQVEELLGQPVARVFANDYLAVNHAVEEGKLLDPGGGLGQSFAEFAGQLMDQPDLKQAVSKSRFLDFFRTAPALATPGRD